MSQRILTAAVVMLLPLFAAAADLPLSDTNTAITFVGSKPNGKHDGGFKGIKGTASVNNGDPGTLRISLEIDMNQLHSDNPKLTNHLKSPDFFGVKSNPKAKFVTTKVEKADGDYKVTGELTMIGQTKAITFPAKVTAAGDSLTLTASFAIDRTQWGMTYGKGKINDEVKLTVSVKAKN
jgi:polyisoprenoid-binding protein YceI